MKYDPRIFSTSQYSDEFFKYPSQISDLKTKYSTPEVESPEMSSTDYLVAFSTKAKNYCVGVVDMVNSTQISARLGPEKSSRYYQIFLNSMSRVLGRFGGFVIKNVGDCLVFYFPESSRSESKYGLMSCLECSLAMIEHHKTICQRLVTEGLPCVDYRVSADYGQVVIMKTNSADTLDLIGPPVNVCTKINRCAEKNGIVIGGDLYQLVKCLPDYCFKQVKGYSCGFKQAYPVYKLSRK